MEKFEQQGLRGAKREDAMAVREFRRQAVGDYDFQLRTPDLRRQERRGEDATLPNHQYPQPFFFLSRLRRCLSTLPFLEWEQTPGHPALD